MVGLFLAYNTMTFSVVQRRATIGMLRALGVTRAEIVATVLAEALLLGLAATALGLGAGVGLAGGLVRARHPDHQRPVLRRGRAGPGGVAGGAGEGRGPRDRGDAARGARSRGRGQRGAARGRDPADRAGGPGAPDGAPRGAGRPGGARGGGAPRRGRRPEPRLELRGALRDDPGRRAPHAVRDDRRGAGGGPRPRAASRAAGPHGGAGRRREALADRRGGGRAHGGRRGDRRRRRHDPELSRDGRAMARDLAGRGRLRVGPDPPRGPRRRVHSRPGGDRAAPRRARRPGASGTYRGVRVASAFGPTQLVALGIGPGSYRQFRFLAGSPDDRVAGLPGRRARRSSRSRTPTGTASRSAARSGSAPTGASGSSRSPASSRTTVRTRVW